jgi:hypothetical protein
MKSLAVNLHKKPEAFNFRLNKLDILQVYDPK